MNECTISLYYGESKTIDIPVDQGSSAGYDIYPTTGGILY